MIGEWFDRLANRGLVLFVSAIVLTVVVVSLVTMSISRAELEEQARKQVFTVAKMLAHEVDRKLRERFAVLTRAAEAVRMEDASLRQFARLIMERQQPVAHLFEQMLLFDQNGQVLDSFPQVSEIEGADLFRRPYFQNTLAQQTPQISEPFTSQVRELSTVVMTAPIFDAEGNLVGVLTGSIVLSSENFLSEVSTTGIGNDGYVTLASRSGLILMQGGYLSGIQTLNRKDPASVAGMEGFEGITRGISRDGDESIVAINQLEMAPWFIAATWPLEDAYAPVSRVGGSLAWITAGVVLVLLPLCWRLFRRYLDPLWELADQIRARHEGTRDQPVDETGYQEIRQLAEAFNRVMAERMAMEARLRAEQQRGDSILSALQEAVVMTDTDGVIRYANPAAAGFLGPLGVQTGSPLFGLVTVYADDKPLALEDFLESEEIHSLDAVLRNDGQSLDVEITMLHVSRDEPDERLVFVIRDDSERRRQEQRLSWQATHDSLTGLLNRRAFSAELQKWLGLASTLDAPSMLMMIDLDHFKPVNDQGGHLLGDKLLCQLADGLRHAVRKSDVVARIGGDEFAILLPACGLEHGLELAERVRSQVAGLRLEQDGQWFGVTASIGLTDVNASDSGPEVALARADEGAYAAKADGRDRVVVVSSGDHRVQVDHPAH